MKIILMLSFFSVSAFAKFEIPNVEISTNSTKVEEIYKVKREDPMRISNIYESQTNNLTKYFDNNNVVESSTISINSFSLIGFMEYKGKKEALLKGFNGEIYIVSNGKIYDSKKKILKDFSCVIVGKQVIIKNIISKEEKIYIVK